MQDRDPDFDVAVQSHMKALQNFARRLCRDDILAEDMVQSTVLRALDKHHLYQPDTNLRSWLYTIMKNDFFSTSKKKRREVEDVDGLISGRLSVPESQSWAVDLKIVRMRMKRMPLVYRYAFEMVCILGHDYEHVAVLAGVPIGTIKSRVNRARDFIESGAEIKEELEVVVDAPEAGAINEADRIVALYKSGKTVSEIAAEIGGLKRSKIMSLLASRNITR